MAQTNRSGFTLIELIVVVAILGTLATLVMIRFTGAQSSARDTRRQSDVRQYQNALEVYANRSNSLYPVYASAINVTTSSFCNTELKLTNCPDDPQGANPYKYQSNASGTEYVVWTRLEKPNTAGNTEYYIVCSNGSVGRKETAPSSATCPL